MSSATIADNLRTVEARIARACEGAGRPRTSVRLLPVSKTHPMAAVRQVAALGYRDFGENKVQEIVAKCAERTPGERIGFAAIGHLQTNKARLVAELASEFQALDSLRVAAELDRRLQALGRTLPVFVQVNSSDEPQKFGVAPEEVAGFAAQLAAFEALEVRGLMTLAVRSEDDERVAACFARMQRLQEELRQAQVLGVAWDELSMGMSGDLELAIAHGATTVRVGQAIFGPRPAP